MSDPDAVASIDTVPVRHVYRVRLVGGPAHDLALGDVRQHAPLGSRWVPRSHHGEGYYLTDDERPWSSGVDAVARWVPDDRDRFVYVRT